MSTLHDDVRAIRRSVGLHRHDGLTVLRLPAREGLPRIGERVASNLELRDAQFRSALCLGTDGVPVLDLLVGVFRDQLVIIADGPDPVATLGLDPAHVLDTHRLIGLDGPFAWELLGTWDTPAAMGLSYLSAYQPRDTHGDADLLVIRAGRSGEYGYLVLVPEALADTVWQELLGVGSALEAREVGREALRHCSLVNWVYDQQREGAAGLDALELQLTWRLDLQKQAIGLDAIRAHRAAGLRRRITAIEAASVPPDGAPITVAGTPIGSVVASVPRIFGEGAAVVAALRADWAHPGLEVELGGVPGRSRSAPFLLNRSLFVKAQRHTWAGRDEIELPEEARWAGTTHW